MSSVGFYSNSIYPNFNISSPYQIGVTNPAYKYGAIGQISESFMDTFVQKSAEEKLEKLFPYGELTRAYNQINRDFGIDIPAKLVFSTDKKQKIGGGYTFAKNEIKMNLSDLVNSDTKIVGIKNGQAVNLVSESEQLPFFVDRKTADEFIQKQHLHGNLGFDRLVAVPATEDEQRKFILQKITHEVIHAQQHMIMRNNENIGSHEIIKAWNCSDSDNFIKQLYSQVKSYIDYKFSVWDDIQQCRNTIGNRIDEQVAQNLLEAVKNYPPVDTEEYLRNTLETDANSRAAKYIATKYGSWN